MKAVRNATVARGRTCQLIAEAWGAFMHGQEILEAQMTDAENEHD